MEYHYQKRWEITDHDVKRADNLRVTLNRNLGIMSAQAAGIWGQRAYQSLKTVQNIRGLADSLKGSARKILRRRTLSGFDRLVAMDIESNAIAATGYNDYLEGRIAGGVGAFLYSLFGESSYKTIVDSVRRGKYPHKEVHNCDNLLLDRTLDSLDSEMILENSLGVNLGQVKEGLEKIMGGTKEKIDKFYEEAGVVKETTPYTFTLASPGYGFSFWQGSSLLAAIDPAKIHVLGIPSSNGEFSFLYEDVLTIGIHEVGHGHQELISRITMPLGLQAGRNSFNIPIHGECSEGVAMEMERFFLKEAMKDPGRFEMERSELNLAVGLQETYVPRKLFQGVYSIFCLKERDEELNKNFSENLKTKARRKLARLTGIKRFSRDHRLLDDQSIDDTVQDLIYFFGERRMHSLALDLLRRGIPEDIVMSGLLTGIWCDALAQERFLKELYVPWALEERERMKRSA